ncbi:MAG TPA: hypothetical protein DCZ94_15830 [Lentisphaeria bacterium]|nr:MAG: hypothetical protein A2X48_18605 [Lentisphaerae bacterium GWF2_49_21]HBC88419.1 hypothetical protein [Lentisphaeria bacterium]
MKSVVIFGAGISGLSAAHELVRLGYAVSVYEALDQAGGFFRSSRIGQSNMPAEYSWHGMGPWYHNTFDLMHEIPFNEKGNIYDLALSRPLDFGIFPDSGKAQFYDKGLKSIPRMFSMDNWEFIKWAYLMLKTWTSNNRSKIEYDRLNAAQAWKPLLKDKANRTWRSCFGPWIGSDWSKVSLHTAGEFFRKQLITKPVHRHEADEDGPAWAQGAGIGWLLFKGPSSEYWFNPWVRYLEEKGVRFFWKKSLTKLEFDGAHTKTQAQVWSIEGAVESGRRAAKAIDGRVEVIDQYRPVWIKTIAKTDDILYSIKAPHIIDFIFWSLLILCGCMFYLCFW